ncbi:hypothetical protein K435DRAFT_798300 [Dendrothele bispora CBS 962.96]|uniref:Uncharacterized protein n=1 Tax=Dendrothele bispora (strain CBS 962.96) TaxID=1314807 RepID=A0A4S8LZP4_DENBC|nr:hypothetical protein K435DRAFT_798300 [Dendrothele bispora CBS 962.96]
MLSTLLHTLSAYVQDTGLPPTPSHSTAGEEGTTGEEGLHLPSSFELSPQVSLEIDDVASILGGLKLDNVSSLDEDSLEILLNELTLEDLHLPADDNSSTQLKTHITAATLTQDSSADLGCEHRSRRELFFKAIIPRRKTQKMKTYIARPVFGPYDERSSAKSKLMSSVSYVYFPRRFKIAITDFCMIWGAWARILKKERNRKVSYKLSSKKQEQSLQEEREKLLQKLKNMEVLITTLYAPLLSEIPAEVDLGYVYDRIALDDHDEINQVLIVLAVICDLIMGLSITHSKFILGSTMLLVHLALSCGTTKEVHIPPEVTLHQALCDFNINGWYELFATCPSCNATDPASVFHNTDFPVFPEFCTNNVVGEMGQSECQTPLLQSRRIKPYLIGSFSDYFARTLADPMFVEQSLCATDDALTAIQSSKSPSTTKNVFEASFVKDFRGPDSRLFVD